VRPRKSHRSGRTPRSAPKWCGFWLFFCSLLLLQLAGVVAVEVTGGPEIPFHPGREVRLYILFYCLSGFYLGLRPNLQCQRGGCEDSLVRSRLWSWWDGEIMFGGCLI
jgi:hypothetical protein